MSPSWARLWSTIPIYVDLRLVGRPDVGRGDLSMDAVECHTDLTTCCSISDGVHRGDWYFPNGARLPFPQSSGIIFEARDTRKVDLRRNVGATSPLGIYRCDIPTAAVHDDSDISVRDRVYLGVYNSSEGSRGNIVISGGMTGTVDLNRLWVTLTCISTGGPATTVTWTRDSTTVTEGTETVLNDPVTAQYTHTLTVTGHGIAVGTYTCIVANNKPSFDSASRVFELDPAPVTILPLNATSVRISWTSSAAYSTCIEYSSVYNSSGLVITEYTEIVPPKGKESLDITLDDQFDTYEHHFAVHYLINWLHNLPIIDEKFTFGMYEHAS